VQDDFSRPLTEKGRADCALVAEFLRHKNIDAVLSSPFLQARDTVAPFAAAAGLEIRTIDDFRERKVADEWILPFPEFTQKQWADFSYKMENGESLSEVQARNIAALEGVLREYAGKNIAVGTHGTALSTIIHYYDGTYGHEGFDAMKRIFPWVVKMEFNEDGCMGMEKIDLQQMPFQIHDCAAEERPKTLASRFSGNPLQSWFQSTFAAFQPAAPDYSNPVVKTAALGSLKAYKYTVIFARYQEKWLYCRHKNRDVFETAGGRVEPGETMLEAAKRELFEETGAVAFDIEPAFDYSVHLPAQYANGQVFFAKIHELGEMPDFEMGEVALFESTPEKMRFPQILPVLYLQMQRWRNALQ
jgi:2,3-bisphosphoglycerate-dependent phosphoglycerate mutase